jgi:hypothetical protein
VQERATLGTDKTDKMNVGIKSTGMAVLLALLALAAVGMVLNSPQLSSTQQNGTQQHGPQLPSTRLATGHGHPGHPAGSSRWNVEELPTIRPPQVHWLPAGANKAARRASQQEALMALEDVQGREPSLLQRNLTGARWCDALRAELTAEPSGLGKASPELLQHGRKAFHAFLGQYSQDWALFSSVFAAEAGAGRRGVYLDLAAAWPTFLSNTFFFDACLGAPPVCWNSYVSRQPQPNPPAPQGGKAFASRPTHPKLRRCWHIAGACWWTRARTVRRAQRSS